MNYGVLAFLIFLFSGSYVLTAQCPEGIVLLSSDEEILAFAKAYPRCTSLDSSLIIGPKKDMAKTRITDISPLSNITKVNGDFVLKNNPWLNDINAIAQLEIVAGSFDLQVSKEMKAGVFDLALLRIGGDLKLSLQSYKSECQVVFKDLIKIGGQITLYSHEIHHILFPSLWKVGGGIWNYSGYAHFVEGEFPNLESVGGRIELNDFRDEGNVILPQLRHVGSLDIPKTKYKIYMGQLETCKAITVTGHDHTISALQDLKTLETLLIRDANEKLFKSFEGLAAVEQLDLHTSKDTILLQPLLALKRASRVVVYDEIFLPFVQGIDTISESLTVRDFKYSKSIGRLRTSYDSINLHVINGKFNQWDLSLKGKLNYLTIENCPNIKDMNGLDLSEVQVSKFYIKGNQNLEDISGLDFPAGVIQFVSLVNNPILKSCQTDWICELFKARPTSVALERNHVSCNKTILAQQCAHSK